jgi:hypothetical protein
MGGSDSGARQRVSRRGTTGIHHEDSQAAKRYSGRMYEGNISHIDFSLSHPVGDESESR